MMFTECVGDASSRLSFLFFSCAAQALYRVSKMRRGAGGSYQAGLWSRFIECPFVRSERIDMEKSAGSGGRSLLWGVGFFVPLTVGFALLWIASGQRDLHARARLVVFATLLNAVSVGVQGAYWLLIRKSAALAILALLCAGMLLAFGLLTLSRALAP